MAESNRTHYDLLGVTRNAKAHEIHRAYDRIRAQMRGEAAAPDPRRLVQVQTAYEVLSDEARREAYDESLRAAPKARSRRRGMIAAGVAVAALALAILAYSAWRGSAEKKTTRDEVLAAASVAVGRLEAVDMGGRVTPLGLAFAVGPGSLASACAGLDPGTQLVVRIGARTVPARVARIFEGRGVCALSAEGMGSWPLALAPAAPPPGSKVYATRLDAAGQVSLADARVRSVARARDAQIVEVEGPAAAQLAGAPLLDTQGRVVGVGRADGRYQSLPAQWIAQAHER